MDIEADELLGRVYAAMDAETRQFLAQFKSNLDSVFTKERSQRYLELMPQHLEIYYRDNIDELEKTRVKMSRRVEDLVEEAQNLKRALRDTEFQLITNDDNQMSLMEYEEKLDQDLAEMRELYQKKKNIIDECLLEQKVLCDELSEEPRELSTNPLATEADISDFRAFLQELTQEKYRRTNEIAMLQQKIEDLCTEMDIVVSDTAKSIIPPTLKNIAHLKAEVGSYESKRDAIKLDCEHLMPKLELLWECLDAMDSARIKYRQMAKTYTQSSLDELKEELKRCKEMRQTHIKEVILKMRERIVYQWDKIFKSEAERQQFNNYFESTLYNEDLLKLHEIEYEESKRFYDDNKAIFELFNERNEWFEKKKALDAKQNDRNRYNNRGGQLLKEEKERKLMDAKIPKIENEIKVLVQEFREQNNQEFLINGEEIIQLMDKDWENYRGTKELLKSARKAVTTPGRTLNVPKTPMSVRGQTTIKRMASTTNLGLSTGNLSKRRHLELPRHAATASKVGPSSSSRPLKTNIKRNLMSQLENTVDHFSKPRIGTMKPPTKPRKSLVNLSAGKIIKKYRRSSKHRVFNITGTDESLMNYSVFESKMKSGEVTNSSVIEPLKENDRGTVKMRSALRPTYKTPIKNNNLHQNRTKSPLKPTNFTRLQTKNVADFV